MGLIQLSVRRPVSVFAIVCVIVLAGMLAVTSMPLTRLPPVILPQILIEAGMQGIPASEIRSLIVLPIEEALASLRGLRSVTSLIRDGTALIKLEFSWQENILTVRSRVREILDTVYPVLPQGALRPRIIAAPDDVPLIEYAVITQDNNLIETRSIAEEYLRSVLQKVRGVSQILVSGGRKQELQINVDDSKALVRGMNITDIARAFSEAHADVPSGEIREGVRELVVSAKGRVRSIDEAGAIIISNEHGQFALKEIADIVLAEKEPDSIVLYNGKECVRVAVYRQNGSDPVSVHASVTDAVNKFLQMHETVKIVEVGNTVDAVKESLTSIAVSAGIGAVSVILILLILFSMPAMGFIAAVSIPVSVAGGILVLKLAGCTLNILSMGGIALAIGMITDNAVVILSAIIQQKKAGFADIAISQVGIVNATKSAAGSTFGSTITTVIVFLPLLAIPGVLGKLYGDLALGLSGALMTGWIFSITAVPALWYSLVSKKVLNLNKTNDRKQIKHKLETMYARYLKVVMKKPLRYGFVFFILCFVGIGIFPFLRIDFFPKEKSSRMVVEIVLAPQTKYDVLLEKAKIISNGLHELTENRVGAYSTKHNEKIFTSISSRSGAEIDDMEARTNPAWNSYTIIFACTINKKIDMQKAYAVTEAYLATVGGISYSIHEPDDPVKKLLVSQYAQGIEIQGDNPDMTERRTREIVSMLTNCGVPNEAIGIYPSEKAWQALLFPDRYRMAWAGYSSSNTAFILNTATQGILTGTIELGGKLCDIRVQSKKASTGFSKNDIESFILIKENKIIKTSQLGKIEIQQKPALYIRSNRSDVQYITLKSNLHKDVMNRAITTIASIEKEHAWVTDLDAHNRSELINTMVMLLLCVGIVLYLVLAAQFESFILPIIILLSVPFALAGAAPFLLIGNCGIDTGSILGMVVLFGTAVNNAIVLFEISKQKYERSGNAVFSAFNGALERIRAITGTSLTTLIALVPLIVSGGTQKSMALAVLGGLTVSSLIAVFMYPVIFRAFIAKRSV